MVDEAHHSTAKTYRRVIDYVRSRVPYVKLIGLTATPFRTAEEEQGLLGKIYTDGMKNNVVVHNDVGITYQISLKDLISRRILAKPVFESYQTEEQYGQELGLEAWESIQHLDTLPEDVARQIADSALRNRLIVDTYREGQKKYGQTIIFAVNVDHAIALNALFRKEGIASDYVVSSIRDAVTGVTVSREDNERKLQAYRDGKLQVLINVNILTEGVDLPKTGTVFLARPTVSTILMTQMVGRALRGPAAGGTDTAYIVSFVDDWDEHIAWVNPESLFEGNNEFSDDMADRIQREIRMISLSKIEEFATMLDNSIDTTALEKVPFTQRIPVGMYAFSYLEENGMDLSCQVMVYDSTAEAYHEVISVAGRYQWHNNALETLAPCEIVFLDPDNGLSVKSVGKGSAKSVKYVWDEELSDYLKRGQSVVLYNHRPRKKPETFFPEFKERLLGIEGVQNKPVSVLTCPKGTVRDYFLIAANEEHAVRISSALRKMVSGPWGKMGLCRIEKIEG